ncbi:MAG: 2-hydroxychromene-2-carboxylate isomerase [Pseudomonadota bacterium]
MPQTVDFYFDFASPNVYLAYKAAKGVEARTGATFRVIPCLLGGIFKATGNRSPLFAYADVKGKLDYEHLEVQRFIEKHGLTKFQFNPHFPINSLLMMRGAIAAEAAGVLQAYVEAGLTQMWEEGLKLDEPDVLADAMTRAGLDGADLIAKTQDIDVKQKLIENTDEAVARGAFGVPTFFVGDEMFFGKDRLGQVEELLSSSAA